MVVISPEKRQRLVHLLGMLGSHFDGERATAGRMAHELIRGLGLAWDDIIAVAGKHSADGCERHRARDHRTTAAACLASDYPLTSWETGFLESLRQRWSRPTVKQADILRRLCMRAGMVGTF